MVARFEARTAARDAGCERKIIAYLLELLDGTLVNTTALVDQVCIPYVSMYAPLSIEKRMLTAGGGRLAGVDVADDDDVDMNLLFTVGVISVMLLKLCTRERCLEAGCLDSPHVDGFEVWKFGKGVLSLPGSDVRCGNKEDDAVWITYR
jgi:hypothetical protein